MFKTEKIVFSLLSPLNFVIKDTSYLERKLIDEILLKMYLFLNGKKELKKRYKVLST
jgi:hypothetical protein